MCPCLPTASNSAAAALTTATKSAPATSAVRPEKKRKLTFKEVQELASLPDVIDAREIERAAIYARLSDPQFLRDGAAVAIATARLASLDADLVTLAGRWEALETIAAAS